MTASIADEEPLFFGVSAGATGSWRAGAGRAAGKGASTTGGACTGKPFDVVDIEGTS
jgi:hypothetical protein